MKKAAPLILVILSLSLALTSCVRKVGWVGINYGGKLKASYQLFDGPQTSTVSLDAGEQVALTYAVEVDSGSLTLTLTDPDREVIWQEVFERDGSGEFAFEAGLDGRYALTTDGQETQGGFDIHWYIEE
jgi:hypothetical protein